jgi:hypothetical protein
MAGVAEDPDLGRGETCALEERGNLVVGVVDGEPFPGKGALRDRRHVLAELLADCGVSVRRENVADPPQFIHRVRPEVQDMAGQEQVGGREAGRLLRIAGYQGEAAVIDGTRVAASRAFQDD